MVFLDLKGTLTLTNTDILVLGKLVITNSDGTGIISSTGHNDHIIMDFGTVVLDKGEITSNNANKATVWVDSRNSYIKNNATALGMQQTDADKYGSGTLYVNAGGIPP